MATNVTDEVVPADQSHYYYLGLANIPLNFPLPQLGQMLVPDFQKDATPAVKQLRDDHGLAIAAHRLHVFKEKGFGTKFGFITFFFVRVKNMVERKLQRDSSDEEGNGGKKLDFTDEVSQDHVKLHELFLQWYEQELTIPDGVCDTQLFYHKCKVVPPRKQREAAQQQEGGAKIGEGEGAVTCFNTSYFMEALEKTCPLLCDNALDSQKLMSALMTYSTFPNTRTPCAKPSDAAAKKANSGEKSAKASEATSEEEQQAENESATATSATHKGVKQQAENVHRQLTELILPAAAGGDAATAAAEGEQLPTFSLKESGIGAISLIKSAHKDFPAEASSDDVLKFCCERLAGFFKVKGF